jgi:uncharacterized protein YfcZ (UPF0381/DUF406 family)
MKIYIVTSGEDNSYKIEAVFASQEDAESFVKKCLSMVPHVNIEEHEVQ